MYLRSFVAGVGLVATTNALLLPPDFTITDDAISTLPMPTDVDVDVDMAVSQVPEIQTVNLDCPGCLTFGRVYQKEIPSHLKLDFRVESTDGANRLTLNGYELYPSPDPIRSTLTAPVLPNMANRRVGSPPRFRGGLNRPQKSQPLGFAVGTGAVLTDDDEDLQLINIDIQIIQVGDLFIESIPSVQVKLVKTPSGKLAIGTIDTVGLQSRPTDDAGKLKECATTICKWKTLFFDKLYRVFKGCSGPRPPPPPHGPPHHGDHRHGPGPRPGPPGPPHHDPHHGPHPHHMGHRNGLSRGLMIFVTHILFPILIGIVAGISASVIGMVAGTLTVIVWRALFRRSASRASHRCRYAHKASKHESAASEEKSGLLSGEDEVEAPPAYMNLAVDGDKKSENEA